MALNAQHSSTILNSIQKHTIQLSTKENSMVSGVMKPQQPMSPLFVFDSLNVMYQGSWGFGQSFSMASNASGTIHFVGSGAGVIILDVTDPTNPLKLSELSTRGLVDAIFYDETTGYLYVTSYFAGFEIWDLGVISSPVRIGGSPVDGLPRGGIYADGNYVYVVTVVDGIQIFDVTVPSSPQNVGNCPLDPNNLCWSSAKSGEYIYATMNEGGMAIVDVTIPQSPLVVTTYNDVVYGAAVEEGLAYLVSYNFGLRILDISDPLNIIIKGSCSIPGFPFRVQIAGDYAYVSNTDYSGDGGVNVVDISDPENPALITTYPGYAEYIAAKGNSLGFTGTNMACTILDISNPAQPVLGNTYSIPNFIGDIYVDGDYAYTGNNGFRVFDISDKTNPVQVGYNVTDGSIVRTAGNKAVYIRESMSSNNPVMIMDISDPTNPSLVGQYMSPVMTNDLEIKDHYAFVSCWWDGLRIIDFQDAINPVLVAHSMGWASGGVPGVTYCYAQALDVDGNYLYILDYGPFSEENTKGLYILDISDILNPVLIKHFTDFTSLGYDLHVVGNSVYIADNSGGLEIIDVTDKSNPITRGYCDLPDGANSLVVTENMAFVADYINGGLQVVNVSDPDNPFIAGYYAPTGCFAIGVDVEGTNIFLADGAGGFQIYNTSLITNTEYTPKTPTIATISWPNPFKDHLKIKVNSPSSISNILFIYDAAGSKIATLTPKEIHDDCLIYEWTGRTREGIAVKPGFYYFKSGDGSSSGKIVRL